MPPSDQPLLNILILLHGLGDTQTPFASLGRQLNLSYTACISLCALSPIPALFTGSDAPSFHWGDDIIFDQNTGDINLDAGFTKSTELIWHKVIQDVLVRKCNFKPREISILGFGQGGMVALAIASSQGDIELGGVISIGGRLPASSFPSSPSTKSRTLVLVLGGSRSRQVTKAGVVELKARFGDIEYVKWAKENDSMPRNREEILQVMRMLARRLRSQAGVLEGAVKVG